MLAIYTGFFEFGKSINTPSTISRQELLGRGEESAHVTSADSQNAREQSAIFEAGLCFVVHHIRRSYLKNGHLTQQSTVLPANEIVEFSRGKAMDMMRMMVLHSLSVIIVDLIQFVKTTKC